MFVGTACFTLLPHVKHLFLQSTAQHATPSSLTRFFPLAQLEQNCTTCVICTCNRCACPSPRIRVLLLSGSTCAMQTSRGCFHSHVLNNTAKMLPATSSEVTPVHLQVGLRKKSTHSSKLACPGGDYKEANLFIFSSRNRTSVVPYVHGILPRVARQNKMGESEHDPL